MSYSLKFGRFVFVMRAESVARLPFFKGSTLRGAMGHAFKRLTCLTRQGLCHNCMFISRCAYAYVFETPSATVEGDLEQGFIPHPFVIEPPLDGKLLYNPGDEMEFVLLLMGRGLEYLPFFITSFEHAAAGGLGAVRATFSLTGVEQLTGCTRTPVWSGGVKLIGKPQAEELDCDMAVCGTEPDERTFSKEEISIRCLTPTRLYTNGKPVRGINFNLLMRSIFRRLDLLGRAHGTGPLEIPFRDFLSKAETVCISDNELTWSDWSRYSERQKKHVMMGGFTGNVTYSGRVRPFFTFIRMAELVHIGKGTVYGMGKITVV